MARNKRPKGNLSQVFDKSADQAPITPKTRARQKRKTTQERRNANRDGGSFGMASGIREVDPSEHEAVLRAFEEREREARQRKSKP